MNATNSSSRGIRITLTPTVLVAMLTALVNDSAPAAPVNFTGIDLSTVASPGGQSFPYTVGAGPGGGTMNVRLLSGPIVQLTTGEAPDPTGMWAFEHSNDLTPATFRFTFDALRELQVDENETLTAAEVNEFILSSGSWTLLSMVNATSGGSGSTISFTGTTNFGPYGHYSISGSGTTFDLNITNSPAFFGLYGTGISINVVPEPAAALLLLPIITSASLHRRRYL